MTLDITTLRGLDAHRSALADLSTRLVELETEASGAAFNDAQKAEFEEILATRPELEAVIEQLEIREAAIAEATADPASKRSEVYSLPTVRKAPENIFDLSAYRQRARSIDELPELYKDGAMRVLDQAIFPTAADQSKAKGQVLKLLARHKDTDYGVVAKRIIGTSDPVYQEALALYATRGPNAVPGRLMAVLQTYSDTDGGFAIPFTIDPTFINTSDGVVNPLRDIATVKQITTKSWQGITTAGVVASYVDEADEAADDAPSDFDNPEITPLRAHVWIPFTAEYQEDYGPAAIAAELGGLITDAKDTLEGTKFVLGTGTGQPYGVIKALIDDTTSIVTTITNDVYARADINKLVNALGPRFRARGRFMANKAIYDLTRAFGTAGEPYGPLSSGDDTVLVGYPRHEASAMDAVATDAKHILLFGDFSKFVIVDRIGMAIEYVAQVFGTSTPGPTGERGLYARWRNSSNIVTPKAFRLLKVQ